MKNSPIYYSMLDPRWRWELYDINPFDAERPLMSCRTI